MGDAERVGSFPALTGADVRVTFNTVRSVTDLDYYSDAQVALPIGIAEMAIPGMPRAVPGPDTAARRPVAATCSAWTAAASRSW